MSDAKDLGVEYKVDKQCFKGCAVISFSCFSKRESSKHDEGQWNQWLLARFVRGNWRINFIGEKNGQK